MNVKVSIGLATGYLALVLCVGPAMAAPAGDGVPVRIDNLSEPVLCAENDNVNLTFTAPQVRQLRIQAVHPAYIGSLVADRAAPDFTSCDMTGDPSFPSDARRVTLYETPDMSVVGIAYPTFWRPASVPVRVGDRVENGLHLVQVWFRKDGHADEVLVVYPPDGYWRARPHPPAHLRWSAYGSSFLVGPVEVQDRPIVDLTGIVFDPGTLTFRIDFARGGFGTLTIETLDTDRMILDVAFGGPFPTQFPFASLRSMYTTQFNADVAQVAWRGVGARGWGEAPIMNFEGANATEIWAGRTVPSRHNTSAPDMVFGSFGKRAANE